MSRGVQDNSTLNEIVGKSDISNVANTVTEAIGNEKLLTKSKSLSGAINENAQKLDNLNDSGKIESFSIGNDGNLYVTYKAGADSVIKKLGTEMSELKALATAKDWSVETTFEFDGTKSKMLLFLHGGYHNRYNEGWFEKLLPTSTDNNFSCKEIQVVGQSNDGTSNSSIGAYLLTADKITNITLGKGRGDGSGCLAIILG